MAVNAKKLNAGMAFLKIRKTMPMISHIISGVVGYYKHEDTTFCRILLLFCRILLPFFYIAYNLLVA
ncbi:hypothetical protein C4A76_14260 [Brevibacillus laterosporus]|nr:hypothetical protein C4A76_14260 [Brevibacillus laterosporus]